MIVPGDRDMHHHSGLLRCGGGVDMRFQSIWGPVSVLYLVLADVVCKEHPIHHTSGPLSIFDSCYYFWIYGSLLLRFILPFLEWKCCLFYCSLSIIAVFYVVYTTLNHYYNSGSLSYSHVKILFLNRFIHYLSFM